MISAESGIAYIASRKVLKLDTMYVNWDTDDSKAIDPIIKLATLKKTGGMVSDMIGEFSISGLSSCLVLLTFCRYVHYNFCFLLTA